MTPIPRITVAALAAVLAAPAAAQVGPQNLAPGIGAGKVLSAQLGIQSPATNLCPNEAKAMGWIYTDFLGDVTIMIARRGQAVGAPMVLQTQPASNGQYVATYEQTIPIIAPVDAEYRILVGGGSGITSNWVRLLANCSIGAGPGNLAPGG